MKGSGDVWVPIELKKKSVRVIWNRLITGQDVWRKLGKDFSCSVMAMAGSGCNISV